MNLSKVYLSTLLTELPTIINYNNDEFKRYLDLFYNETSRVLIVPLTTTGRVKGATGEFVNIIVDNLTVKNQYTNMYDNNTTADYNWYKMITDPVFVTRDPCTASTWWPSEDYAGYKVIDVNKPYYKIDNSTAIFLANNNLSQVVGIYFDSSVSEDPFTILMNPSTMETYTLDASSAGSYMEFIATYYDPSLGSFWERYKYGIESGSGNSGGGGVGPGTIDTIPIFTSATAVGDSPLRIVGGTLLEADLDVSVGDVIIHNAIRDSSGNILLGYGSPLQINDPASGRDVSIYGTVNIIDGSLDMNGIFTIDGSVILNGVELGPVIYDPVLSDSLAVPTTVGGITAGTTVADLRGKTLEQIINDLLFPTVLASVGVARSLTLSGISGTLEIGTLYGPVLTATLNSGTIVNGDGTTDVSLVGAATQFVFRIPGNTVDATYDVVSNSQTHNPTDVSIQLGTNTWTLNASWGVGTGTYSDNKGNVGTNLDAQRVAGVASTTNTITGLNRRYWGTSATNPFTTSTDVTGLASSELATAFAKSFTIADGGGEYIYYSYPTRFGAANAFTVGGFATTFIQLTLSVTNLTAVPYTEDYYVYRSLNAQTGTNIAVVVT